MIVFVLADVDEAADVDALEGDDDTNGPPGTNEELSSGAGEVEGAAANSAPTTWSTRWLVAVGEMVRVWWPRPREWCTGEVEKVVPATVQVYCEGSDTFSKHRLKSTRIESLSTHAHVAEQS